MKVECTVGVELETHTDVTKTTFNSLLPSGWWVHSDGSIPYGGWEGVSPILEEDYALSGELTKVVEAIKSSGGKFIDAQMPAKNPKDLSEYKQLISLIKRLSTTKDPRMQKFLKDEILRTKKNLVLAWKRDKKTKLKSYDSRHQEACGLHVHVGVKDKPDFCYREKDIAAIIYDFYYDRYIKKVIVPSRDIGGSASEWAKVIRFDDGHIIASGGRERYEAVNTRSNKPTIEYRQGSINQTIPFEAWIGLVCDITRGAVQISALYPNLKTAGEVKAILPYKFKNFRLKTYEWSIGEEYKYTGPETLNLKGKFSEQLLTKLKTEAQDSKKKALLERVPYHYANITHDAQYISVDTDQVNRLMLLRELREPLLTGLGATGRNFIDWSNLPDL